MNARPSDTSRAMQKLSQCNIKHSFMCSQRTNGATKGREQKRERRRDRKRQPQNKEKSAYSVLNGKKLLNAFSVSMGTILLMFTMQVNVFHCFVPVKCLSILCNGLHTVFVKCIVYYKI